jgi:hypothetical protein
MPPVPLELPPSSSSDLAQPAAAIAIALTPIANNN